MGTFNLLASNATQPPTATLTMNAFLLFTACVAAVSAEADPQFYARHSYGLTAAGPILAVNQAHQAYPYHHGFPVAHAAIPVQPYHHGLPHAAPAVAVHAAPVPAVAGPGPVGSVPEVAVEEPTEQIDIRIPDAQPVEVYRSE